MTSIVRPLKHRWTAHQRNRSAGQYAPVSAMERELEDMEQDAERLTREARERIEHERRQEAER